MHQILIEARNLHGEIRQLRIGRAVKTGHQRQGAVDERLRLWIAAHPDAEPQKSSSQQLDLTAKCTVRDEQQKRFGNNDWKTRMENAGPVSGGFSLSH